MIKIRTSRNLNEKSRSSVSANLNANRIGISPCFNEQKKLGLGLVPI